MHGLCLIRPLTRTEQQNLERLFKGCEAPGCLKPPECAITRERADEAPLIVYACIEHAKSWSSDAGNATPEGADSPI
jgi:hypothetical protein